MLEREVRIDAPPGFGIWIPVQHRPMDEAGKGVAAPWHEAEGLGDDVMVDHRVRDAVGEECPIRQLLLRRGRIHDLVAFPLLRDALEGLLRLRVRSLFTVQDRPRKRRILLG